MRRNRLLSVTFLSALLCASLILSAKAEAIMWSQTYGGTGTEVAYSIVTTSDGGYAIAGYTTSFGINGFEFWLVKTDSNGVMQWNRTYGRGGPEWESNQAYSLIATSDGGYALAGYTRSYGAGSADYWLVKTDSSGNVQWNKTYGGDNFDKAESVVATSDGGYAIVGIQRSFEPHGVWLVKTDASGNMQWNQTYEGLTGDDRHRSVITTPDGGYALTGGPWMVKTDELGNLQWNTTYYGKEIVDWTNMTYSVEFYGTYSLVATSDGGYVLAGYTLNATGQIIPLHSGNPQFVYASNEVTPTANETFQHSGLWLVKIDAVGNMQWNQTYEGGTGGNIFSLIATSDGGYAIADSTTALDVHGDFWLIKTDEFGNMEWNKTYGGTTTDKAHSLLEAPDGGYVLAGEIGFHDPDNWHDFWVVKTDEFGNIPEAPWVVLPFLLAATLVIFVSKKKLLCQHSKER